MTSIGVNRVAEWVSVVYVVNLQHYRLAVERKIYFFVDSIEMKPFAAKIKALRKSLDLGLEEWAKKIGVSRSMAGHYETESQYPTSEKLARIASVSGTKIEELAVLLPADHPARIEASFSLPLLGAVAAGGFCPVLEPDRAQRIQLRERYPEDCLAAFVSGHSCTRFGIFDGDLIVIRPTPTPINGSFVVAESEGGLTLKGFWDEELWGWGPKSPNPVVVKLTELTAIRGVVIQRSGPVRFAMPPARLGEPDIVPMKLKIEPSKPKKK